MAISLDLKASEPFPLTCSVRIPVKILLSSFYTTTFICTSEVQYSNDCATNEDIHIAAHLLKRNSQLYFNSIHFSKKEIPEILQQDFATQIL